MAWNIDLVGVPLWAGSLKIIKKYPMRRLFLRWSYSGL
jgi:hypothetical protein